jgi:L-threonylcarbamoyladenylate synthase
VSELDRCVAAGGVAVFPADTVYGLGCDPENAAAVRRLYELKGRPAAKPAAVMWGRMSSMLSDLDGEPGASGGPGGPGGPGGRGVRGGLGPGVRLALERLLPGPVTVLIANPRGWFPLAGSGLLGVRVPAGGLDLDGRLLQSSANVAGGPDARRLADVPQAIRDGADLVIDGGELPGVPSTVVDLSAYEVDGSWTVVRVGALTAAEIGHRLGGLVGADDADPST